MPFLPIQEDSKNLRESYDTYYIQKFKPALNEHSNKKHMNVKC